MGTVSGCAEEPEESYPVPDFVRVSGARPQIADAMEKELSPLVGKPVNPVQLDQQIMRFSGNGRFSNLSYSMVESKGKQGLLVQTEQKPYAPPVVRPLILIDGSDYNNVLFSMGARITFLDFGSYRSKLRNDVIVGSQYLASSEYYHRLTSTTDWFIARRGSVNSTQTNLYSGTTLTASYRVREALGGGCGLRIWPGC
jgi:NTE family protein